MPVPKRKRSHSRIAKAHANKGYKVKTYTECSTCKAIIMPHQVCKECGHYKGAKVLKTKGDRAIVRGQTRQAQEVRKQERAAAAKPTEQAE